MAKGRWTIFDQLKIVSELENASYLTAIAGLEVARPLLAHMGMFVWRRAAGGEGYRGCRPAGYGHPWRWTGWHGQLIGQSVRQGRSGGRRPTALLAQSGLWLRCVRRAWAVNGDMGGRACVVGVGGVALRIRGRGSAVFLVALVHIPIQIQLP